MAIRLVARNMNPRLTISENNGTWTLRTEMPIKNSSVTFTPGVLFEDKTPDGQEIKVSIFSSFADERRFLVSSEYSVVENDPIRKWSMDRACVKKRWQRICNHPFCRRSGIATHCK